MRRGFPDPTGDPGVRSRPPVGGGGSARAARRPVRDPTSAPDFPSRAPRAFDPALDDGVRYEAAPYGVAVGSLTPCPLGHPDFGQLCCLDAQGDRITDPVTGQWLTWPVCDPAFPGSPERVADPAGDVPCVHPLAVPGCPNPFVGAWHTLTPEEIRAAGADLTIRAPDATLVGLDELLAAAVAMLRDSWDLVAWCCCTYFGPGSEICDCLHERVFGAIQFETATDADAPVGSEDQAWTKPRKGATIFVNIEAGWPFWVKEYFGVTGFVGGVSPHNAVVKAATIVLHELVHQCADEPHVEGEPCNLADAVGSCIAGVLYDRYPAGLT